MLHLQATHLTDTEVIVIQRSQTATIVSHWQVAPRYCASHTHGNATVLFVSWLPCALHKNSIKSRPQHYVRPIHGKLCSMHINMHARGKHVNIISIRICPLCNLFVYDLIYPQYYTGILYHCTNIPPMETKRYLFATSAAWLTLGS